MASTPSFTRRIHPHHVSGLCKRIFLSALPTRLDSHNVSTACLASCVPPSLTYSGTGILNLFPIAYAVRPRLRGRLTLGGRTFPRKSWDFGGRDSHPSIRYSCPHNHLYTLHARSPLRFNANTTLLYHSQDPQVLEIRSFGNRFSPDHFRRKIARLVSCYALFKWWLPLSQHPSCLCNPTSLVT